MASYADSKYAARWEAAFGKKIRRLYGQAQKEVEKKLEDFTKKHQERDAKMREKLDKGQITEAEYMQWLQGQVFMSGRWRQKVVEITKVYVNADKKAREMVRDAEYSEFTSASNFQAWDIEKNTRGAVSFDLYDDRAVTRLIRDNPQMLPKWKINEKKDYVWNEKRLRNSVTQAIIQGEGIDKLAKRLSTDLSTSNRQHMVMFARTAITGAQNEGSLQRMRDAEGLGLKVQKRWLATLDSRTRDSHADLDGQTVDVDEPFVTKDGTKIMCPGDPSAPPEEVCNCRCTMITVYPQYENLFSAGERRAKEETTDAEGNTKTTYKVIPNQTYEQWAAAKKAQAEPKKAEEQPEPKEAKASQPSTPQQEKSVQASSEKQEDKQKHEEPEPKKEEYTSGEKEAVEAYVSGDMMWINQHLRNHGSDDELTDLDKEFVDDLDKATTKEKVEDKVLYRAVDAQAVFGKMSDLDFENLRAALIYGDTSAPAKKILEAVQRKIGKTVKEEGYMSTTRDPEIAYNWNGYTGSTKDITLELTVPDGVNGFDVEKTLEVADDPQREVLLERGLSYRIDGLERRQTEDGVAIVVKATIISEKKEEPEEPKQTAASVRDLFKQKMDSFTPASTLGEAEAALSPYVDVQGFGATGVSYKGISIESANEVNRAIIALQETFDVEKIGGVVAPAKNTKLGQAVQSAVAGYSPIRNSYILNRDTLKSVKAVAEHFATERKAITDILTHPENYDLTRGTETLRRIVENSKVSGRATVPESISDVIAHEFGHSVERLLKKDLKFDEIKSNMASYAPRISGYAHESLSEYIAESMASYLKGEDKIDPVLREAFERLRRT